jgi:hypothetical protein
LSAEDYERRIVALHADGPAMPTRDEDLRLRRAEFDLGVDHRLGIAFPPDRRERLWAAHQRVDRRRAWYLLKGLLARSGDPADPIARALIVACADELDDGELRDYFSLDEDDLRRILGDTDGV